MTEKNTDEFNIVAFFFVYDIILCLRVINLSNALNKKVSLCFPFLTFSGNLASLKILIVYLAEYLSLFSSHNFKYAVCYLTAVEFNVLKFNAINYRMDVMHADLQEVSYRTIARKLSVQAVHFYLTFSIY